MFSSKFETTIDLYDEGTNTLTPIDVIVEFMYAKEQPSHEYDPGEPELFEISCIRDKTTGVEITRSQVGGEEVYNELEVELEKEIRDFFDEQKNFY